MAPPSTQNLLAIASLMALLAMATTGQPLPGTCDDLAVPAGCSADECEHECSGMGGDSTKAYCNDKGKCCCPARNALICQHYDDCKNRIAGCMRICKDDWGLDPARAYCRDSLGNVRDSCCCRPNVTAIAVDVHRHVQLDLHR